MTEILSNFDIEELCKFINVKLIACTPKDLLAGTKRVDGGYIINLDNSGNQGTHWVSLHVEKGNSVYFDSFGIVAPTEIISFAKGTHFIYNQDQIQAIDQSCCGWYCIAFLHHMQHNQKYNVKQRLLKFCAPFDLDSLGKNDNIVQDYFKNIL